MGRPITTLKDAYAILETFALEGKRCPENDTYGIPHGYIPALARAGWIRILISGRNYRQVVLLKGPNAGKATAPNPGGMHDWKVVDSTGIRINGKHVIYASKSRPQPSMPRLG
jgi:hypothetical protein